MRTLACYWATALLCLASTTVHAQARTAHMTVYDAGVAEFLEERMVPLEPGMNQVEWRSLMPRALVRTLRITADGADVVRQEVVYDGPEVRNQRSPVLRLTLRNRGGTRDARVQVDYLAPGLSWVADYSLVLDPADAGAPATGGSLDAWVSLSNNTGADVHAGTVDLVAGEIALLSADGDAQQDYSANVSQSRVNLESVSASPPQAGASSISAFSRFRLGRDIALNASAAMGRHPLFQGERIRIVQRNVFENGYNQQTMGSGGFVLLPRGLDVRLVGTNPTGAAMPAGQVTVYARQDGPAQVVGQDRISLTPAGGEFTLRQGRSNTLFGTRRVLERSAEEYRTEQGRTREKLTTRVEVVVTNRGPRAAEVFVREGIEASGDNEWRVLTSSAEVERMSANTFQVRLQVPANGEASFTYTVESR
ncbi:MAG TPA: hypothetical protein VE871_13710 [Longimicrobium sp.]|nr:hypothetical protein [Longimicrobium sp.]